MLKEILVNDRNISFKNIKYDFLTYKTIINSYNFRVIITQPYAWNHPKIYPYMHE